MVQEKKKKKTCDQIPRTWKRIIHSKEGEDFPSGPPSLKRPYVADECLDFQRKKRVVSQDDQVAESRLAKAISQPRQGQ